MRTAARVWTLLSRHAFEDGGAVVLVADIDELKGSERAAHDATRRLSALVAAQREVAELELDLDAALAHVAGKTQELTGADGAAIYVREGDSFVPVVAVGNGRDLLPVPAQASLAGTCASGGVPVVSGDIHTDPRTAEVMRDHVGVRSVVMVPMAPDTAPYALIAVVYERPAAFDDVAVETARVMAEFAAAALRNAREHRTNQSLVAALAESEQRFRSAIDSSPIGFALCTTDDRYLLVNDAFCRIAGRTREELELLTWRDLTHPDDLATDRELAERVLSGAIPHYQTEKRFVRPDGAAVWVRMSLSLIRGEDGKPSFGVAQIQDITEPRLLEQSLRERERLFRAVFDQSLVGKILFDDAHRVVDANEAACDLTGLTRRELIGRSIDDFAPPDAPFDEVWEQLEREGVVAGETPVVRPDGAVRIVIFSGRRDVQPGLHLTIVQDMTEQRELEERLRQGQKMEAVGRLAGGIAHDFNNMLTAIGGYAQLLIAGTEPGSGERRHAELIAGAADRAAALTRQLLAFSRRQVLQPAALDPNEVIRHTRELVTRLIGEDVRLETRLLESTEPVFADVGQLEQVIVNLAVNARDAMPQGGLLTIETDTINVDPEQAREAVATPGRYTRLTISDTGVGMDAETLERLFEPFYSTKGDNGTGLGLATVYGIVRQSGGFVTVESEPGRGSSFRILLPATARPATLVEGPSEPEACDGAAPAGETILLVEDEEIVRAIVTEMLEERGYVVLAARDGADAVATAAAHEGGIDLLVSDVVMPGMSGQEVAARIAEARPDVRTLFVSGYSEAAVRGQGVLAPGTSFLEKPFSAEDLARKVRETLDGSVVLI